MLIGLTGTPGTGKTSVCNVLKRRYGYRVIHLNDLIREENLHSGVDEVRDTLVVDIDKVSTRVHQLVDVNVDVDTNGSDSDEVTIIDSHMSHYIADIVIVLRTSPDKLRKRLLNRDYPEAKISENVEAEALDVILVESVEWCDKVFEINTTDAKIDDIVEDIDSIIRALLSGEDKEMLLKYSPGAFDWSEEIF